MIGLLIVCMAELAMASATTVLPDKVIINPDGNTVTDVAISIMFNSTGTYQTQVYTTGGLYAYLESSDPIAVGNSNNWASETPLKGSSFNLSKRLSKPYSGTLHIKGTREGIVTVRTDGKRGSNSYLYSVEAVNVSVPEFPTVALPVAAALGLLFVFGRKRAGI